MAQYATTIVFEAGSTTTVTDISIAGQSGAVVTLKSSVPGTQFTLTKASGNVVATHTAISDSNATGGAYWDATSATNFNFGNNNGWDFNILPVTGEFFSFF